MVLRYWVLRNLITVTDYRFLYRNCDIWHATAIYLSYLTHGIVSDITE